MHTIQSIAIALALVFTTNAMSEENKINYPSDYKSTYTNYLSLDRTMNPDQIIRLFANEIAMQGPGSDDKLPYGSIVVAEIYKAKKGTDGNVMTSSLGRRLRGDLALIAVMQREEGWGEQFPESIRNGNWEMATFKPDGSKADKDINACMACHAPLTEKNFLFSYDHLLRE